MGKISNYTRALVAKLQDVFVVDQTDNNVTTTKSVTVEQIGDTIAGTQVHSDLKTDNQTIIGGINELAKDKNVADEYDDTQTYDKGDVVIYKNTLYICTTNNTTGAWDATKWTATTVQSLIGDLSDLTTTDKSSLVGAVNEVNGKQNIYATTPSNKSVTPASFVTLATLTVPKGVYVVGGFHEWTEGFGEYYIDRIGTTYERNLLGRAGGGHSTSCIINVTTPTATLEYFTYLEGSTTRTAKTISFQAVKVL